MASTWGEDDYDVPHLRINFYLIDGAGDGHWLALGINVNPMRSLQQCIEEVLNDYLQRPYSHFLFGENLPEPLTNDTDGDNVMDGSRFYAAQTDVLIIDHITRYSPYFIIILQPLEDRTNVD